MRKYARLRASQRGTLRAVLPGVAHTQQIRDAVLALHKERLSQCEQWSELLTALALAATLPEGQDQTDLIAYAADLAWELTGDGDLLDPLVPEMSEEDDRAAAARGRARLRSE